VVILIDEYDAPLNDRPNDTVAEQILTVYRQFFTQLKALDEFIQFAYVTGITSYGLAGIYSGANNFVDLSSKIDFESHCAVTEEELRWAVKATRPQDSPITDEVMEILKKQYNGYSWNLEQSKDERHTFFNPLFVASYCNSGKLEDYWGKTSSGSLFNRFTALVTINVDESEYVDCTEMSSPWYPSANTKYDCARLLFEAGYFTVVDVKSSDSTKALVQLAVPNEQVRMMLNSDYTTSVLPKQFVTTIEFDEARKTLLRGDMFAFFDRLDLIRASIPYHHKEHFNDESAFVVFALQIFRLSGVAFVCEESSFQGRSDFVLFAADTIFVLEFKAKNADGDKQKLKSVCDSALHQIEKNDYSKSQFIARHKTQTSKLVWVAVVADKGIDERRFAMIATKQADEKPILYHLIGS